MQFSLAILIKFNLFWVAGDVRYSIKVSGRVLSDLFLTKRAKSPRTETFYCVSSTKQLKVPYRKLLLG
jgi:hypothetical protein